MHEAYPELQLRAKHLIETTRSEEERFLETIAGGMARFDELAPATPIAHGSPTLHGTVSGEEAFQLYDTYGFPFDLTELMARERGYDVDVAGFEAALAQQRTRSQEERKSRRLVVEADDFADPATWLWSETANHDAPFTADEPVGQEFVGYDDLEIQTKVVGRRDLPDGRTAVILARRPFYLESGGQVSDRGEIVGQGWRMDVEDVRRVGRRVAEIGRVEGTFQFGDVAARVPADLRRDTERNHTATHLLHAALRTVLGEHVHQRGSLVAPDRLRFDFSHGGPMQAEQVAEVETLVNREIWRAVPVDRAERPYREAVADGAMALFGEKYGDVVRVITVPGFSKELCGGTHVRNTSEIALFKIVAETGVGGGTRRIEAVTGPAAYARTLRYEQAVERVADALKAPADPEVLVPRVEQLVADRRTLERRLASGGGGGHDVSALIARSVPVDGARVVAERVESVDVRALQSLGDALREKLQTGIGVLAASFADGKNALLVVVTDDLRERGIRADTLIGQLAAAAGGRGGGKPHMAQAGIPDAERIPEALDAVVPTVRQLLGAAAA
jgi:alanyl-tRNA synthetase